MTMDWTTPLAMLSGYLLVAFSYFIGHARGKKQAATRTPEINVLIDIEGDRQAVITVCATDEYGRTIDGPLQHP